VCKGCNGGKFKTQEKVLIATVEPGMRPGDVLRFENECSDQHEYEQPGDVHVVLREADEKSLLTRQGDDLRAVLSVSFQKALLGGKETLQGHPAYPEGLSITIPHGSMRGDVLTLNGEGMPVRGSSAKGGLVVTLGVDVSEEDKRRIHENKDRLAAIWMPV
jgi:DnaJ-class molecular chaperone